MARWLVLVFGCVGSAAAWAAGCSSGEISGGDLDDAGSTIDGAAFDFGTGDGSSFDVPDAGDIGSLADGDGGCGPNLTGIVRDFKDDHPDFEKYTGDGEKGLVEVALGGDSKPVLTAGPHAFVTSKATFDQWYRNVDGVNQAIPFKLDLTKGAGGISTYDNPNFFPIDGKGFGNQGREHNFHFTYELHTVFEYRGGEVFRFVGDDDLWVFVNGRLAIDLGGVHAPEEALLDLDAQAATLGIERGRLHGFDLFFAERHTTASTFHVSTTIASFDPCR